MVIFYAVEYIIITSALNVLCNVTVSGISFRIYDNSIHWCAIYICKI